MKKFNMNGGVFTDKDVKSEKRKEPEIRNNKPKITTEATIKETSTVTQVDVPNTSAVLVPNVVITKAVEQNVTNDRKVSLKELLIENKWWIATAIAIAYYATMDDN